MGCDPVAFDVRGSPLWLRDKFQVLRTRRPTGRDAATLAGAACLVKVAARGGERDSPQLPFAGATSKLKIVPRLWRSWRCGSALSRGSLRGVVEALSQTQFGVTSLGHIGDSRSHNGKQKPPIYGGFISG